MSQVFGDFKEDLTKKQEHLTIVFSPISFSLKERWRNNSLSADFLADYFANFFPGADSAPTETSTRAQVKSAISYIANELLENAVKFHYAPECNISLTLQLERNELVFLATNSIDPQNIAKFQAFIVDLINEDPGELYFRQLEQNALDENNSSSGLGLLTMIEDYGARVGWKFEEAADLPGVITVTTMVQMTIHKPEPVTLEAQLEARS